MSNQPTHIPVLVEEIMHLFSPQTGDSLLDATLGLGGHAAAFLEATYPQGTVVGLEADPIALKEAQKKLAPYSNRVRFVADNFRNVKDSLIGGGIVQRFTHVLFDLGVGSHQLDDPTRGFSFRSSGPLTMAYHQQVGQADVLTLLDSLAEDELATLIYRYGEERYARRIAHALKSKKVLPNQANEVAEIIRDAVPAGYERGRLHPATRTFQALRIAINQELESLEKALPQAFDLLLPGGTMAVISFHSLEDRIVKRFMKEKTRRCICPPEQPECTCTRHPAAFLLTKKPLTASESERATNIRSHSAKLRALQKK